MEEGITEVPQGIRDKDIEFKNDEIAAQKQKIGHQKILFWSVMAASTIFMIIALISAFCELKETPSTQDVTILGLMMTAPIILVLALMRYVYEGKHSDNPQPTLLLNIVKEIAAIFKK